MISERKNVLFTLLILVTYNAANTKICLRCGSRRSCLTGTSRSLIWHNWGPLLSRKYSGWSTSWFTFSGTTAEAWIANQAFLFTYYPLSQQQLHYSGRAPLKSEALPMLGTQLALVVLIKLLTLRLVIFRLSLRARFQWEERWVRSMIYLPMVGC